MKVWAGAGEGGESGSNFACEIMCVPNRYENCTSQELMEPSWGDISDNWT